MLLRLSDACAKLAVNARTLIDLLDAGRAHLEGEKGIAIGLTSIAIDGLRDGLEACRSIDSNQALTPALRLPVSLLDDATLDQVSQFAGGTAGLGIEQTLAIVLQMGLSAASDEIARNPLGFTLRAQAMAHKCAKPPLNFVFMSGASNPLNSDACDRRFFVANNEAAQP